MRLVRLAQVWDIREHPRLDTDDDEDGHNGGNDLREEHHARGDLHVMAELKVA